MAKELPGIVVSATSFIRQFGHYSRTAGTEPIHILNHGRPAWSLVSTDYLTKLTLQDNGDRLPNEDRIVLSIVLDAISTCVTVFDEDLRAVKINPAARHAMRISDDDFKGMTAAELFPSALGEFICRALHRVRDSGLNETLEIDTASQPPQTYQVRLERFQGGITLLGENATAETLLRAKGDLAGCYELLIDGMPHVARGMANVRGVVTNASPALAALLTTDGDRITGMRLPSFFHASSRADVSDAMEALLEHGTPFMLQGALQVGGTETQQVALSAAPLRNRGRDGGIVFLVQKLTH